MSCKEEQLATMLTVPTDPYLVGLAVDANVAMAETQPGLGQINLQCVHVYDV